MRYVRMIAFVLIAGLAVLPACNGDDDEAAPATTSTDVGLVPTTPDEGPGEFGDGAAPELEGPVNDRGTVEVTTGPLDMQLGDVFFDPTFVQVPEATELEVSLANTGQLPHTFTVDVLEIDEELQPGDERTVTVRLPENIDTGLRFYCRFHEAQGMQGAFFS